MSALSTPTAAQDEIGWTSSARFLRMSEADFEKLKKKSVWGDIRRAEKKIISLKSKRKASQDRAQQALISRNDKPLNTKSLEKVLEKEANYQEQINKKLMAIMEQVIAKQAEMDEIDDDDEETMLLNSLF